MNKKYECLIKSKNITRIDKPLGMVFYHDDQQYPLGSLDAVSAVEQCQTSYRTLPQTGHFLRVYFDN